MASTAAPQPHALPLSAALSTGVRIPITPSPVGPVTVPIKVSEPLTGLAAKMEEYMTAAEGASPGVRLNIIRNAAFECFGHELSQWPEDVIAVIAAHTPAGQPLA